MRDTDRGRDQCGALAALLGSSAAPRQRCPVARDGRRLDVLPGLPAVLVVVRLLSRPPVARPRVRKGLSVESPAVARHRAALAGRCARRG
ncbi:MAG: hypothetical protein ACRD0K_20285, partial [Egibacteraceae bacterium]